MRVFLTGGTGFLGSHLAAALSAEGHEVVASVRATSDTRWLDPLEVETAVVDLASADVTTLAQALDRCDAVLHCGGLTRAKNEAGFMAVNALGSERLARAAVEAGARRFVFVSSLAARGPDEASGPISPYGRSKAEGERLISALAGDLDVVIVRPGGVYGPHDSDLFPLFEMARKGLIVVPRSSQPLQPVFVDDAVSATIGALAATPTGEPLPIAHPALHPWASLAEALESAVGRSSRIIRVPPSVFWTVGLLSEVGALATRKPPAMDRRKARDMSVHRWTCDITSTREAIGWTPEIDIEEGLARTAAWYREAGWL
ncbi:MAG: NAD-dependent epimerase/dehydratase family protein [Gemmatimonadota bacterium]|nr:NAD-dependent epimerase/dehydratase family protein [Gemmatimonadota bacterium]